ncbi:MAG: hypothetical protein AAFV19_05295 [Pseudomonadota bacterium]
MSVVSGLSTSNGVSTLLNARREVTTISQAAPGEPARDEAARRAEGVPRGRGDRLVRRPVLEPAKGEETAETKEQRAGDGSRHTKFLLAVQALRLDQNEISGTSPKLNAMLKAAQEIFMVDDGIPRQVTSSYPAGLSDRFKFPDGSVGDEIPSAGSGEEDASEPATRDDVETTLTSAD